MEDRLLSLYPNYGGCNLNYGSLPPEQCFCIFPEKQVRVGRQVFVMCQCLLQLFQVGLQHLVWQIGIV